MCSSDLGCVEAAASGPSVVRWARTHGWSGSTARDLATAAEHGDPLAVAAFDRAARALAAGFVSTAAVCDLDLIVVGGGVARAGQILFDPLRRWVSRLGGLAFLADLCVAPMALGGSAGLVGAAALLHEPGRYG